MDREPTKKILCETIANMMACKYPATSNIHNNLKNDPQYLYIMDLTNRGQYNKVFVYAMCISYNEDEDVSYRSDIYKQIRKEIRKQKKNNRMNDRYIADIVYDKFVGALYE